MVTRVLLGGCNSVLNGFQVIVKRLQGCSEWLLGGC